MEMQSRVVLSFAAVIEKLLDNPVSLPRPKIGSFLSRMKEIHPAFIDFLLINTEGKVLYGSLGASGTVDLSDREYVRRALAGDVYISGFFRGRSRGEAVMTISTPVRTNGKIALAAAGFITLENFLSVFEKIEAQTKARLLFVNDLGRLVSGGEYVKAFKENPEIDRDESRVVRNKAVDALLRQESGTAVYRSFYGEDVYGVYRWFPDMKVGMILEYPRDEIDRPVSRLLRYYFLASLGVFFALILFICFFIAIIFKPVDLLIKAIEDIIARDYHEPIVYRTGSRVDLLIDRFNEMGEIIRRREIGLKELASRDSLTGLYNHGAMEDFLAKEYERKKRSGGSLSFVMADLDKFKEVNDNYGHRAGDYVLQETARILLAGVRAGDTVARYGGEEFAILVENEDPAVVAQLCERIRAAVEAASFYTEGTELRITISLGWALMAAADCTGKFDVVKRADEALYRAKNAGRNRARSWD
jgi:diguanylate cyclase (GGDEF)-like protein